MDVSIAAHFFSVRYGAVSAGIYSCCSGFDFTYFPQ